MNAYFYIVSCQFNHKLKPQQMKVSLYISVLLWNSVFLSMLKSHLNKNNVISHN